MGIGADDRGRDRNLSLQRRNAPDTGRELRRGRRSLCRGPRDHGAALNPAFVCSIRPRRTNMRAMMPWKQEVQMMRKSLAIGIAFAGVLAVDGMSARAQDDSDALA